MANYIYSLFGLQEQIDRSINLMREYEPPEGYYLCLAAGKIA